MVSGFTPTDRDREGLERLVWELRKRPRGHWGWIRCFNRDEARWIKRRLRARGFDRIYCTWLRWPSSAEMRAREMK